MSGELGISDPITQDTSNFRSHFIRDGFLPEADPAIEFSHFPQLKMLDQVGQALPEQLLQTDFRDYAKALKVPPWPVDIITPEFLPELRLYYVRLGFLASGYINQVGQMTAELLPQNIAKPFVHACKLLNRPAILSYDGYALYNWKRLDATKPIALGNIDTLQNFVHLYDEHWFILIHIEIEAIAADILSAMFSEKELDEKLTIINQAIEQQTKVLKRIPEKMSADLYFKYFRPYIRFYENVQYEGVSNKVVNFRGETGAQSSILPLLETFLKIPHKPSILTEHLLDMRQYMPADHRALIDKVDQWSSIKEQASHDAFNGVLEALAQFREVHYQWAIEYINEKVEDPRGTGGTPFMKWLKNLIDETRAYKYE